VWLARDPTLEVSGEHSLSDVPLCTLLEVGLMGHFKVHYQCTSNVVWHPLHIRLVIIYEKLVPKR
jgi:hypothetical protein